MKTNFVRVMSGVILGLNLLAGAPKAQAQDQNGWVGGLFGVAVPDADGATARPIWGITGGAKVGSEFGIGAYYLNSNKEEDAGDFNLALYGLEAAYHFEGEALGVYLGGRIGMTKIDAGVDFSPMHWGVVGGYNHMLSTAFSIGGEASYLMVSEDSPLDSFGMLNFMASAKFWF